MTHTNTTQPDFGDLAALYAAGALTPDVAAAFEALLTCNEAARAAYAELQPAVETLLDSVEPVMPDPASRTRLLARLDQEAASAGRRTAQVWRDWDADQPLGDELHITRASEADWEETGVPGVRVRKLFVDRERNQFTAMVQMDPGTSYPRHIHDAPEECLVLHGDLHVGDTVMRAGDYQRAPAHSHHGVQSTEGGCRLLIVSSLSDEIY